MKFKSEYHENADDLLQARNEAWSGVSTRRDRLKYVRQFTNMMNTMTEEEADKLGRTEITNHGLTYRDMLQNETQFTSMVTVTNSLLEVVVDTDNPEQDSVVGMRISEAINRNAIHYKGKFANFWRKVAGEIVIAGGCPVIQNEKYGWLPKPAPDMFFPPETSLDAEDIPYAFSPVELTVDALKKLKASVKGEQSNYIDIKNVDILLDYIKERIKDKTETLSSEERDIGKSARTAELFSRTIKIKACWYYEVKYKENGDQYVSSTLFVDNIAGMELKSYGSDKKNAVSACIVVYIDKAFDDACEWLHNVCVDSEIGGVKNMDTLKGVAEMTYPSNVEMEELVNLMMEGDKIRARPKVRITDAADADAVAKWDIMRDTFAPAGVEELPFKGDSRGLMTPLSLLGQNSSGMSGGAVTNGPDGGELRQQALERQKNTSNLQANRISEAYNHLESILETVVYRILAGPAKPGTEGYREIMAVRDRLDQYGIDYKELAKRKYGRFIHIRVRARRSIGNGDRVQQLETSDWMLANLQNIPPGSRPLVLKRAFELRTQDPDLADAIIKVPKSIINSQKITAENECDTIKRRSSLGQVLPVADDDIHQDHVPIHMLDMQSMVADNDLEPWTKRNVLQFAGLVEHTGEHLSILMANPVTNGEAKRFIMDYQNIVASAQPIIQGVEEKEGNDQGQLTPKEQADIALKMDGRKLEWAKLGVKTEDMKRLAAASDGKHALAQRSQYTKEINENERLKVDKERVAVQAAQKKENKTKAKK